MDARLMQRFESTRRKQHKLFTRISDDPTSTNPYKLQQQ